jgi:hypothetical protein
MAHGGFLIDKIGEDLGLSPDAPIDLIGGPLYAAALDLRPQHQGGDDDAMLRRVLRVPTLLRRISVSAGSLREGSPAQQEAAAQPEARNALAFHRVKGGAYRRSVAHAGRPMRGTPASARPSIPTLRGSLFNPDVCVLVWQCASTPSTT